MTVRFEDIFELTVAGVFGRGTPNEERIVLTVNETVNMAQFGLLLGIRLEEGTAAPIRDNFFWFGEGWVRRGDWIFVYTGPGGALSQELPGGSQKLYTLHWGRDKTILNHPDLVPILFRLDAVTIPAETPKIPITFEQKA